MEDRGRRLWENLRLPSDSLSKVQAIFELLAHECLRRTFYSLDRLSSSARKNLDRISSWTERPLFFREVFSIVLGCPAIDLAIDLVSMGSDLLSSLCQKSICLPFRSPGYLPAHQPIYIDERYSFSLQWCLIQYCSLLPLLCYSHQHL